MKLPECEIDRDAPYTPFEKASCGLMLLGLICAALAIGALCGGCVSENTGSSTVVGEQMALPEITDSSDSIAVRVYESIKGARVWTAKDSKVVVRYTNAYTNEYFGIVTTRDAMNLEVEVEPLATDCERGETAAPDGGEVSTTNSVLQVN